MRQERDERRKRLRKERGEERAVNVPQRADQFYQSKHFKSYDKSKLPSGILSVKLNHLATCPLRISCLLVIEFITTARLPLFFLVRSWKYIELLDLFHVSLLALEVISDD